MVIGKFTKTTTRNHGKEIPRLETGSHWHSNLLTIWGESVSKSSGMAGGHGNIVTLDGNMVDDKYIWIVLEGGQVDAESPTKTDTRDICRVEFEVRGHGHNNPLTLGEKDAQNSRCRRRPYQH